jgi:hypothetical protein
MYERTSDPVHRAIMTTHSSRTSPKHGHVPARAPTDIPTTIPGVLLSSAIGPEAADEVRAELHSEEEDTISRFAETLGLKFFTVSELNTSSSAFCGLFYQPGGNSIILGFKGMFYL